MSHKDIEKKYRKVVYQNLEIPDQLDAIKSRITFEQNQKKSLAFNRFFQARLSYVVMFLLSIGASLIVFQHMTYSNISDQHFGEFIAYAEENTDAFLSQQVVVQYRFLTEKVSLFIGEKEGEIILFYFVDYPFDLFKQITINISGETFFTKDPYGIIELQFSEFELIEIQITLTFSSVFIPSMSLTDKINLQPFIQQLRQ